MISVRGQHKELNTARPVNGIGQHPVYNEFEQTLDWTWQTFFALRNVRVELQDSVQQLISHHGTQGINFCMHLLRGENH